MNGSFIQSLPLVASALGRKYGIKIIIGGDQAATNGDTIFLPGLPLDSPSELVNIARGYLDHEAAHIRATNFKVLKSAKLTALEMHIWNIIEDYRVEKIMAGIFPGCRQNFRWLILHLFDHDQEGAPAIDRDFLNWLLLQHRSWSVPELQPRVECLERLITTEAPGLIPGIQPTLKAIRLKCPDTRAAINYAKEIVQALTRYTSLSANLGGPVEPECQSGNAEQCHDSPSGEGDENSGSSISALNSLIGISADALPASIEKLMEAVLSQARTEASRGILNVALECPKEMKPLPTNDLLDVQKTAALLKCRLQSKLQSLTLKRATPGYRGKLDPNSVHKLFISNPRIFRTDGFRVGLSTAVHMLVDTSGSMRNQMILASHAAFALCKALSATPGVSVAATAFPGNQARRYKGKEKSWETVSPILRHGQKIHSNFQLEADGGTPLGEAIWWVMQQMSSLTEQRKIIMILTDGEPDCLDNTKMAISSASRNNFELYGLGLGSQSIKELLPGHSVVINKLAELPHRLFQVLSQAIQQAH